MSAIEAHTTAGVSYLLRRGAGTPVVLLHGIGSQARSFLPLMEALDGRFSVLAWDAPGYGDSTPLAVASPDASDYAAALDRWLGDLGISRCILIGHSLGTLVAARLALVSPDRVAMLALISPALGYGVERTAPLPPPVASRLDDLDRLGPEAFAAKRAPGLVSDPAARPDVLQQVETAMAQVRRPGYDHALRLLASGQLLSDAAQVAVPTAVWVGTQDRITPPANARHVFDALQSAMRRSYREIDGAGHAVCQECPDDIARAIASLDDRKATPHA